MGEAITGDVDHSLVVSFCNAYVAIAAVHEAASGFIFLHRFGGVEMVLLRHRFYYLAQFL